MNFKTLALAGCALLVSTQAFAAPDACIRNIDIWSYKSLNDRTLIVESTHHQKYKLNLIGNCWNLNFKEQIAFKSPGGSSLSCLSRGDEIISHDLGMRQTCSITKIEAYTPSMQAADKAAKDAKMNHSSY